MKMGLYSGQLVKILQIIKANGVEGKTIAMLGKQELYIEQEKLFQMLTSLNMIGMESREKITHDIFDSIDLFKIIGFERVHVIDYSDYEGADIICDLNEPVQLEYYNRFDYIIDGGTLEHIFDIAQAMKNITHMLRVNGIVYHGVPSDGWVNHGFYSISPIFFLDYYASNGFEIPSICMQMEYTDEITKRVVCEYTEDLRCFDSEYEINKYMRKSITDQEFRGFQVICFAQKQKVKEVYYPIQGRYDEAYKSKKSNIRVRKIDYNNLIKRTNMVTQTICLFGCGYICDLFLDEVYRHDDEICIDTIFDNDVRKTGNIYRGYKICYPTKEKISANKCYLITNVNYAEEIFNQLLDCGVAEQQIIRIGDFCQ